MRPILAIRIAENPLCIEVGLSGKLLFAYAISLGERLHHFYHESALITLAAIRNRRHIRTVGLQNDAIQRNYSREVFTQMTALESRYATDAQNKLIEGEQFFGFLLVARKAMEDAPGSSFSYFLSRCTISF